MSAGQTILPQRATPSVALAIVLIVVGLLAIAVPAFASIGAIRVLAWLVLFDGVMQLAYAFRSEGVGRVAWKLLVAVLYIGAGVWLLVHPFLGLAGLTLVLAAFFFAEGITDVIAYFLTRKGGGSSWMLLNGAVTMILALMIWRRWPFSSLWVVGTLLGISMLMTGTIRLMMALAVRKRVNAQGDVGPFEHRAA